MCGGSKAAGCRPPARRWPGPTPAAAASCWWGQRGGGRGTDAALVAGQRTAGVLSAGGRRTAQAGAEQVRRAASRAARGGLGWLRAGGLVEWMAGTLPLVVKVDVEIAHAGLCRVGTLETRRGGARPLRVRRGSGASGSCAAVGR